MLGATSSAAATLSLWMRRGAVSARFEALKHRGPTIRCSGRPRRAAAELRRSVPKAQRSEQFLIIIDVSVTGQVCRPDSPGTGPRRTPRGEENTAMRLQHQWWTVLGAAVLGGLVGVTAVAAAGAQFLPVLSYREGAQRFTGIPRANGYLAYLTLLNERDGGIHGVK